MADKTEQQKNKKILVGTIVGIVGTDTVKVAVQRYIKDAKYKKFVKKLKNYLVDDKGNTAKVGDKVKIEECKPISKRKTFRLKK